MAILKFNLPPKLPRWATEDPDNIVEPGETDKDDGHLVDNHVPSGWLNWYQNLNYQIAQIAAVQAVSTWKIINIDGHSNATGIGITYKAAGTARRLTILHSGVVKEWHWAQDETRLENMVQATLDLATNRAIAWDDTYTIIADYQAADHQLAYLDDSFTKNEKDVGQDLLVTAIGIKRTIEDSNYILIGNSNGYIRKAASVSGSWTPATTSPQATATVEIVSIAYMGDSKWICMQANGDTFTSIDDGDVWLLTTDTPKTAGILSLTARSLDVNTESGTVIAVDDNGAIARSNNGGHSWTSVVQKVEDMDIGSWNKVLYCGGDIWAIVGDNLEVASVSKEYPGIIISKDDGETWGLPGWNSLDLDIIMPFDSLADVACDGRKLVALSENGRYICVSNSLQCLLD